MSNPEITVVPGIIYWFDDYYPVELGEPCVHPCAHQEFEVVAWGPTFEQYEMVLCLDCSCRGWRNSDKRVNYRMVA